MTTRTDLSTPSTPAPAGPVPCASVAAGGGGRRLRDGRRVRLRPLAPADAEAQLAFFEGLSERSRRLRFVTPMPRVSASRLRPLLSPDGRSHFALGAFLGRELVAVARWIVAEEGSVEAEVALAVADALQGLGLGRVLIEELSAAAREAGLVRLRFEVAGENRAMQRLLERLGVRLRFRDGLGEGPLEVAERPAA